MTGNSAALLCVLGKQLTLDRERRRPSALSGWLSDSDVVLGVWGAT